MAFVALLAGLVFGVGLAVSGMFDTSKVLGFLDIAAIGNGGWDPSLAFVMAGALAVALPAFRIARRWRQPALASRFHAPEAQGIDAKLLIGALLFGLGWGLVGYCPGPALAALAFAAPGTIAFVLAMAAGMLLQGALNARR
jgi:uncharacterized membrane protein YedE/YeeE